ncbi:Tumor necrosis factor alpha-induced protein 8-like protein 3 [Dissostichus eleginoides]|uniref:Tumor necrosis factor alpha-induced protein 8-like protein 3 n=1 Tax=Dissostichus eleginoides TaxID=100907 RepID=A0AAD9BZL6_DISEL|nr:Tumor necrosis factor alpha-induced protein 8-like protein 3 [Dissostichus eleginoides]
MRTVSKKSEPWALGRPAYAIWCPVFTLSNTRLHTWEMVSPATVVGPPTARPPAATLKAALRDREREGERKRERRRDGTHSIQKELHRSRLGGEVRLTRRRRRNQRIAFVVVLWVKRSEDSLERKGNKKKVDSESCVLQGKMDSDSGEQSDGDLSPGPESFNSRSLALQAQKKILSKMATMVVANMLTDDTSSEILDELYKTSREFTKSKKQAHKIIKDVIKIALKIGILYRNHQFSPDELDTVDRFKKKMNQAAMTAVSFYEVEYTFDRNILSELLLECRDLLHTLVEQHLTARSHARIDHVFNHFSHGEYLAELYGDREEYRLSLRKICNGINKLLDEGTL